MPLARAGVLQYHSYHFFVQPWHKALFETFPPGKAKW